MRKPWVDDRSSGLQLTTMRGSSLRSWCNSTDETCEMSQRHQEVTMSQHWKRREAKVAQSLKRELDEVENQVLIAWRSILDVSACELVKYSPIVRQTITSGPYAPATETSNSTTLDPSNRTNVQELRQQSHPEIPTGVPHLSAQAKQKHEERRASSDIG
eukprot:Skav206767  [mRNA]  locus=scaffold167:461391:461867:+ [translate_table: standard]